MKVLLVFAVVVTTSYATTYKQETMSKEYTEKLKSDVGKCRDIYAAVNNDNLWKVLYQQQLPTQDEMCYMLCYAKLRGYYLRPGQMNLAKLRSDNAKKFKDPKNFATANEIEAQCAKEVERETQQCATAAKFFVCRAMEIKARGFKEAKLYS